MSDFSISEIRDYLSGADRGTILEPGFVGVIAEQVAPKMRGEILRMCQEKAAELDCSNEFSELLSREMFANTQSLEAIFGQSAVVNVLEDVKEDIPEKQWLIDGLCTRGECAILSGASKSGKSYLMTNLAVTAACGGLWLGRFQCKKSRVLYLNGENEINDARARFHAVFNAMGVRPEECDQITMLCADGAMRPIQDLKECLMGEVIHNHYDLVILDPLYCFYRGSEIDEQDAKGFVSAIKGLCRDTGAVVFCVHHHSKGAGIYKNASSRASGSGMLQRAFSTLLDVSEVECEELPEGQHGFEFSGQPRQAASFKMNLIFDFPVWKYDAQGLLPDNAHNKARTAAARNSNKCNQKAAMIKDMLPKVLSDTFADKAKQDQHGEYITMGDVVEAFSEAGTDVSERSIGRKLEDGIDGFTRDVRPGMRRYIRRKDFCPAAESILPESWKTGSAPVAPVAPVI